MKMGFQVLVLLCLVGLAVAAPDTRNQLTCDLCTDIITDLDNFITSDTTEGQIVDFIKQICHAMGQIIPGFEDTCNSLIENQLPAIIDALVNDNLNPTEVCTDIIGACP